MTEEDVKKIIREELEEFLASDRYIFSKTVQFLDGRNIKVGVATGTKIGTNSGANHIVHVSDTKIGFFGKDAIVQQGAGSATAGGTYGATEQSMLQKVYDVLRAFGFMN